MSAKEDLESIIKNEAFSKYGNLLNKSIQCLVSDIEDKLHYAFETSKGFNGKIGVFLFSCRETINLLKNIGYASEDSPISAWDGKYVAELTQKAKEMYQKLKQEGFYKSSNIGSQT